MASQERLPKVLVGCPTSYHKAYCLKEYAQAIKHLDYPNYDILLVDNSSDDAYMKKIHETELPVIKGPFSGNVMQRIVDSRNALAKVAIDGKYDYVFMLEQDVIPEPDALRLLVQTKKDVVTGVYCMPWPQARRGKPVTMPLLWDYFTEQDLAYLCEHLDELQQSNPGLHALLGKTKDYAVLRQQIRKPITLQSLQKQVVRQVKAAGLGCMLIGTSILQQVPFRVNPHGFDDATFCEDLEQKNIPLFMNSAVLCDHLVKMGQWENLLQR